MIFAGICITFSSVSLLTWGTDFAVNYKDFSLREASVSLAVIGLLSALFWSLTAIRCGSPASKHLLRAHPRHCGRIPARGALSLAGHSVEEKATVLVGLFVAGFFMSWYHGPVTAVLHDMMPRRAHATSVGVYMFATHCSAVSARTWSVKSLIFTTCSSVCKSPSPSWSAARCSCLWSSLHPPRRSPPSDTRLFPRRTRD